MIKFPKAITNLPTAGYLGKADGGRWVHACSICDRWFLRRNRYTLAGAIVCQYCAQEHNESENARRQAYSDAHRYATREAISMMQAHADVASPDAWDSPGAVWLLNLYHSAMGAWENGEITPDAQYPEDRISELADSAVPIYTHNRWQIFADLCAYDFDSELIGEGHSDGMTGMAGVVLYEIAQMAISGFREEMTEEFTCDDCGEFPCECPEYGECLLCGWDAMTCYEDAVERGIDATGSCLS